MYSQTSAREDGLDNLQIMYLVFWFVSIMFIMLAVFVYWFGFAMGFNPDTRQFLMDKMFDRANLTMVRWKNPHEIKALIEKVKSATEKGVEATEEIEKFNGYVKDCGDAFTYFREQANAAEEIWVEIKKDEVHKKRFCIQFTDGVVFFLGRPCTGWFVYLIWARLANLIWTR